MGGKLAATWRNLQGISHRKKTAEIMPGSFYTGKEKD
jgi:hypothetical protein